jgi:hypothetical protein
MVASVGRVLLCLGLAALTSVHASHHTGSYSLGQPDLEPSNNRRDAKSASTIAMPREPLGTHPPLPLGTPHVRSRSCTIFLDE